MAAALLLLAGGGLVPLRRDARGALARTPRHAAPPRAPVLLLFFLGFATKAGLLPDGGLAEGRAPGSALGRERRALGSARQAGDLRSRARLRFLLPASAASETWGTAIALVGAVSLFVGTLTALEQEDSKRLMAFHTIGQIGYVCLALGVGVAVLPRSPALGALGLMAALSTR